MSSTIPDDERTLDVGTPGSGPAITWRNPRKGFLFFLGFAAIGAGMAQLTPAVLTLSIKAQAIDPRNGTTVLSIVIAIGAILALIAFPLFGRLSDRTTSRLGRRRPWILLGAILIAAGAPIILAAHNTAVLTIGWILTTVGYSSVTVAVTSLIPDQFEPLKRGPASAIVGISLPVGALVGLFIAQAVSPNLAAMILLPAAVAVVGAVVFVVVLNDRAISKAELPPFGVRAFFSTFWVNPARHPSFALAWFSRLCIFLGIAAVNAYQAFYLIIALHFKVTEVAGAIFLSTLALTISSLVLAPIAGKISDRIGRRKPFVIAAAVIFTVGLFIVANAHDFGTFIIAMAVMGVGQGVYLAVDVALITQILPDPENPGQAVGVMNLANNLPGSIIPAIAPAVLAIGASAAAPQNFTSLFLFGAIAGIVGALLIIPIRGVK